MSNTDEVTLKMAEAEDAQAVLQLLRQINRETAVVMIDHLSSLTVSDEQAALHEISVRSDCIVLLAMLDQQPVGIVTITKIDEAANAGELGVAVLKSIGIRGSVPS